MITITTVPHTCQIDQHPVKQRYTKIEIRKLRKFVHGTLTVGKCDINSDNGWSGVKIT